MAYFSLVHWTVKYMDWIYIPDLWHGKCLIFQIFGCPTRNLERILALTHHSTVMKIQGKHVFKHLTQCLALSINLCLALSINKYVIVAVISTSRFLLDSHLHGEQLAVRVVRGVPRPGSAPGAGKLLLCPSWVCQLQPWVTTYLLYCLLSFWYVSIVDSQKEQLYLRKIL